MIEFKDLFLKLLTYFRTGDKQDLDEKLIAIAISEKSRAEEHFKRCIDLPAFRGKDYEAVRQFLIDWYASGRTLVSLHRTLGDPYALDYDTLSEYIKSMGFIFPDYIPKKNRATFLLELANLYKIKGSPQSLLQLTKFLDYLDFKIVEYWLVADQYEYDLMYDTEFFYDEEPPKRLLFIGKQIGRMLEQSPLEITYTYDQFRKKLNDGHWYHTKRDIGIQDSKCDVGLPSLTPYFGLFNDQYVTKRWLPTYAVFSRLVKQQYHEWVNNQVNVRSILFDEFGQYVSFLELVLSLWYCFYVYYGYIDISTNELNPSKFSTLVPDPLQRHICYCLDLAQNIDRAQLHADYIRYFETAPATRDELYQLLAERQQVFTSTNNFSILPDPREIKNLLQELNPELFEFLYRRLLTNDQIKRLLNQMWEELDTVIGSLDLALSTMSNTLIFEGVFVYSVINFFKPFYCRLANFAFVFNFTDRLGDAILVGENIQFNITVDTDDGLYADVCQFYDCPCQFYDEDRRYILCDTISTQIKNWFEDQRYNPYDGVYPLVTLSVDELLSFFDSNRHILTSQLPDGIREYVGFYDGGGQFDTEGITLYENLEIAINT